MASVTNLKNGTAADELQRREFLPDYCSVKNDLDITLLTVFAFLSLESMKNDVA